MDRYRGLHHRWGGAEVVSVALLLFGIGGATALAAHIGCRVAEKRARESYRELVNGASDDPADGWEEIRPLAGRWGCLVTGFEFLRGLGMALAGGTAIYLIVGGQ